MSEHTEYSQENTSLNVISTLEELAKHASYSLVNTLNCDPQSTTNGIDYLPRQVFCGHYVPVRPTAIENPEYVTHSSTLFAELGLDNALATSPRFTALFSGDTTDLPNDMRSIGWATGYALSIFGTEYTQQCPFQTGNAYGDGRAISIFEAVLKSKRWEMQLKGAGPTPYCRGADGRAVLRSSVREFLAQEFMHALGVPTSRSLSLYVSTSQRVSRPWYSPGTRSHNPDILMHDPIAISTRVAPSFLRVGQLELFARRARKNEHKLAHQELEMIVLHAIEREYSKEIDNTLSTGEKVVLLAFEFRRRLTKLVANWIRVGFCQGNFNSDNCTIGGFTLDYGPFGFMEAFDPRYQSWTGGGEHFSFFNQGVAAQRNFDMLCKSLLPLLDNSQTQKLALIEIQKGFGTTMQKELEAMWASKLGLTSFNEVLINELFVLMTESSADYTLFFRSLCSLPKNPEQLQSSFYANVDESNKPLKIEERNTKWEVWLNKWHCVLQKDGVSDAMSESALSEKMKSVNPKYTWREWLVAPAYQQANHGDYTLVRELQTIMSSPYAEQSKETEAKYYALKPLELFAIGGLSHYSCSS